MRSEPLFVPQYKRRDARGFPAGDGKRSAKSFCFGVLASDNVRGLMPAAAFLRKAPDVEPDEGDAR